MLYDPEDDGQKLKILMADDTPLGIFNDYINSEYKEELLRIFKIRFPKRNVRFVGSTFTSASEELRKAGIKFCNADNSEYGPTYCNGIIKNGKCQRCETKEFNHLGQKN